MTASSTVIQVLHDNTTPFYELGQLYTRAFKQSRIKVVKIYLSGEQSDRRNATEADKEYYLNLSKREIRGLKFAAILRLRQIIRRHQPSLILASRYKPLYISLIASLGSGIQVVGLFHAFGVLTRRSRRQFLQWFKKRLYILGVSKAIIRDLTFSAPSLTNCMQHMYNCVDQEELTQQLLGHVEAREKLALNTGDFIFANVGRLHPDKGQDLLIKAFAQVAKEMPLAKLLLIGVGRCETRYRDLANKLNISESVIFAGYVKHAAHYFPAFDVYVSTSDKEPFGMVLLEAQCARVPIVAAKCGGAAEVVGDTGLLFDRSSCEQLSAGLLAMYQKTAEERKSIAEKAIRRQERLFSFSAFAAALKQAPLWSHLENQS